MRFLRTVLHIPKTVRHLLWGKDDRYIHKISDDAPWALICYIPYVFYYQHKAELMSRHQSHWEMIKIDEVLISLGYNTYHHLFSKTDELPDIDFKLVIGLEPSFCEACHKYPNAKKIYYATGAYVGHQNGMVKKLTVGFNEKYGAQIPYRRTAPENNAAFLAEEILQIGSSYTIDTYPEELRDKITLIHQSSQAVRTIGKIEYAPENEYFFMSSSGNILKGLPQMIECFSKHPDKVLHIVGPIEGDVTEAMGEIPSNIVFHGFMNVNSDEYLKIIRRCNFTIYPSSSEGGVPGGVLNCMKNGLIPIVSRWSSFDEINDYGYQLADITAACIEKCIVWAEALNSDVVVEMKRKSQSYVSNTYNLENFAREFRQYILEIMNK